MQWPAAGVGLVAQRLAAESRAEVAEQHRCVVPAGLVQLQEAKTAIKDVPRAGEPGLRQNGRENAGICRVARLQPLGQRPVQDALAIAGGVTVGDAEGGQHLFRRQAEQFACGRGGAEHPDRRGAMPAPVERARERDAARYVQTKGDRQQDITPADNPTGTLAAIAYREDRPQHGNAGMDGTPGVQRVIEIQRMTHTGIQQCGLWRRQASAPQQHTAFLTPSPPGDHRKELVDPRRAAAAKHAAKRIENIATGRFDRARR
jgi:hypothetical protein